MSKVIFAGADIVTQLVKLPIWALSLKRTSVSFCPAPLLQIQLSANVLRCNKFRAWIAGTHMCDSNGVTSFWFGPDPALVIEKSWLMSKWMEDISFFLLTFLSLSAFQTKNKYTFKENMCFTKKNHTSQNNEDW